ncbi:MAG: GNAT family N-acetyltransferase [Mycobacterium sp.]|nr:GNAT family N-acetyltransferase [Mycobacterium sp.]
MEISVTPAAVGDVAELAVVAAATFPLACPDSVAAEDIAAFVATHLSEARFAEYLAAPERVVLAAREEGRIIGYAMLIRGTGDGDGVELSKIYVLPSHHSAGAAAALLRSGIDWASGTGAARLWLGVNQRNARAQRFYRKQGFEFTGTRTFRLGGHIEHDYVMARPL